MNCHLVTIEVGVESTTNQWMKLDCLPFHQFGLESLDGKSVKRGCPVEQNRMAFEYILQDLPNNRGFFVHHFLGGFHRFHDTSFDELSDDKRFEKLCCHTFRNTAF